MFKSDKKLLVSGCGITFSGQTSRTWVNILNLTGLDIVDVSAPAVSNQWIINRAFLQLYQDPDISHVVIQLTAIGKLDVEVDDNRMQTLVDPDPVRNFTVDGVWPSSTSTEHASKRLWKEWLCSPGLEQQDIFCKLLLLKHWCDTHQIKLLVIQGYDLRWNSIQKQQLESVIDNVEYVIMNHYQTTDWYKNKNSDVDVPVLGFQVELAANIIKSIRPDLMERMLRICQDFAKSCR